MLETYRAVFRAPGSPAFAAAGLVMGLPMAIYPIGLVLIVSARTGHYGFASALSGVFVLANGAGNPTLARLSDRLGQRRVLVPASVVHAVATMFLGVCIAVKWPDWTLVVPAAISGFTLLSVGSLVRARWSYVLTSPAQLNTAYSIESTIDEVIFVVGPLIATLVATQVVPVLVLYVGVVLVLGGAVWLASLHASEPPPQPIGAVRHRSALRERGMPLLALFAAAMGMIFAGAEIPIVAFSGQHGHPGASGAVLASFALGSASAGFLYGSRQWRADLLTRFRLQASVFALLPAVLLAASNVWVLGLCAFVVGSGIAPTLITAFGLVERIVPSGSLTEGLAWLITGICVGYAAGASIVGRIADAHGARLAFLVAVAAGLAMGVLGLVLHARLGTARSESQPVTVG